jgi:hypothetical protein
VVAGKLRKVWIINIDLVASWTDVVVFLKVLDNDSFFIVSAFNANRFDHDLAR